MSFKSQNPNRQLGLVIAYLEITLADFLAAPVANVLDIAAPIGCELVRGHVNVITASNAGTTDILDVGHADDDDEYTGTAIDLKTAARTALVPTGYVSIVDANRSFRLTRTPVGTAATALKLRVFLEYAELNRGHITQS